MRVKPHVHQPRTRRITWSLIGCNKQYTIHSGCLRNSSPGVLAQCLSSNKLKCSVQVMEVAGCQQEPQCSPGEKRTQHPQRDPEALCLQRLHRIETQCETQRRQHYIIRSTCQVVDDDMPLRLATINLEIEQSKTTLKLYRALEGRASTDEGVAGCVDSPSFCRRVCV